MGRHLLLTGFLATLATGRAVEEAKLANCRSALAALRSRSPFEVSAMCRSALPSETCRSALRDLGAMPWTPDKMGSACQKYVSMLAPLRESKGRILDDIEDKLKQTSLATTLDPSTGEKIMTQNPWTPPAPGALPFPMAVMFTGRKPPKTPTNQEFDKGGNETFPAMPPLPDSLDPNDCLGSITFAVHEIAGFNTDPVFQEAIVGELAKVADTAESLITITAVHVTPFVGKDGLVTMGGNVEVFFKISSGDATRASRIQRRFASCNHQEFGYHMWNHMTSHGSNQHTMIIMESVEAKPVATMKKTLKTQPAAARAAAPGIPTLAPLPKFAPFRMPALPPAPTPAPALKMPKLPSLPGLPGKAPAPHKGHGGQGPPPFPLFTPMAPGASTTLKAAAKPPAPAPSASKAAFAAAKGLAKLLGKKSAAAPTLLQDSKTIDDKKEVVEKAEVHEGQTMAKEGAIAATRATGWIAGAALCVMGALALTRAWRRRAASYRTLHLSGGAWAPADGPEAPPTATEFLRAEDRELE